MRVTTNMMMRNYNSRLNKIMGDLNVANQKVGNRRKFLTAAESPAEAARAYQLRRTMQKNADYMNNVDNVYDSLLSVESNLMKVSDIAVTAYVDTLEAINGTMGLNDRKIFAQELRSLQESALMNLNAQFDDKFLFGGTGTKGLPFELNTDASGKQTLYYRGLDVSDPANQDALKALADEKVYMDLGFGLKEDGNEKIIDSSVFNAATPGIKYLGFGIDPSDNFILNLGKLADLFEQETLDDAAIKECTDKLDKQRLDLLIGVTELGGNTNFLKQTKGVLEDNEFNLNNKIINVELMDMEEAIMNFQQADYIYRAALQMGTKILSPSFIDFMN